MSSSRDHMELIIPSDFKYLGAVDAAIQDLAREHSCAQRWINDFSTALVEACTNAIEHGNKYAKDKIVRVEVKLNGKEFVARIHDQGSGFDFEKYLADIPSPPDPLSERGRGIMIMTAFTDRVSYSYDSGGGLCLELAKTCVQENAGSAVDSE